jgi:hypothetical protein
VPFALGGPNNRIFSSGSLFVKIRRVPNQLPQSSPPSAVDDGAAEFKRFVWEVLAPRLLHPSKLAFIQALLERHAPLSVTDLADAAGISFEHAAYVCRSMATAGVLEVTGMVPSQDGEGDEPTYFFPKLPQGSNSPSSGASGTSA